MLYSLSVVVMFFLSFFLYDSNSLTINLEIVENYAVQCEASGVQGVRDY